MTEQQPEAEYFYTTDYPHRWSSGAHITKVNPDKDYAKITSLEEAKELAEKFSVDSYGEDRCVTTYGVQYKVPNPKK